MPDYVSPFHNFSDVQERQMSNEKSVNVLNIGEIMKRRNRIAHCALYLIVVSLKFIETAWLGEFQ
jgi:hypothetical protein